MYEGTVKCIATWRHWSVRLSRLATVRNALPSSYGLEATAKRGTNTERFCSSIPSDTHSTKKLLAQAHSLKAPHFWLCGRLHSFRLLSTPVVSWRWLCCPHSCGRCVGNRRRWRLRRDDEGRTYIVPRNPQFDMGAGSFGLLPVSLTGRSDNRQERQYCSGLEHHSDMIRRTLAGVDSLLLRGTTTTASRNGAARQVAALRGLGDRDQATRWATAPARRWSSQEVDHKVCV